MYARKPLQSIQLQHTIDFVYKISTVEKPTAKNSSYDCYGFRLHPNKDSKVLHTKHYLLQNPYKILYTTVI